MTPAEALAAIEAVRHAAEDLEGTAPDSDEAAEIVAEMARALSALQSIDAGVDPVPAWVEVGAAFEDLQAWLAEPVAAKAAKAMTREERLNMAISIATRGRRRTRDAADVVLDTFYGGLEAALRGVGRVIAGTARLAGRATLAAGEALGEAIHAGAVRVDAYIRNGKPVRAHERSKHMARKGDVVDLFDRGDYGRQRGIISALIREIENIDWPEGHSHIVSLVLDQSAYSALRLAEATRSKWLAVFQDVVERLNEASTGPDCPVEVALNEGLRAGLAAASGKAAPGAHLLYR